MKIFDSAKKAAQMLIFPKFGCSCCTYKGGLGQVSVQSSSKTRMQPQARSCKFKPILASGLSQVLQKSCFVCSYILWKGAASFDSQGKCDSPALPILCLILQEPVRFLLAVDWLFLVRTFPSESIAGLAFLSSVHPEWLQDSTLKVNADSPA